MTFERTFKASSYCMIGSGFAAIALTGSLHWFPVVLFLTALIASWFLDTARLRKRIPVWIINGLSIAFFLFFIMDFMFLSQSFLVSVIHLTLLAAILKVMTLSKDRDYFILYLLGFSELLAATALTVNLVFGICLLIFLVSGILTFILFEMRRSNAAIQDRISVRPFVAPKYVRESGMELFGRFPAASLMGLTFGITLFILVVALPLFLLLPRLNSGFYRQPSGETQFISGFSESVELGREGSIGLSDAVVMRVRTSITPSQLPADLKWRGLALDHFDGRAWKRSNPEQYPVSVQGRYFKLEDSATGTAWLHQTFFLEALSTNVVFAARKALAVSRESGFLSRDTADNLFTSFHAEKKLRYEAISDLSRPDPALLSNSDSIPVDVLETCLQLPFFDRKIENLAKRVTASATGKYEKAKVLERHLRTRYDYSLELTGTAGSNDPLAEFLFETRKGHCEYFASAMAIMLRYTGIPSRLVNGFRSGEYNNIGDNWIVRQYHAHSWVEAYLPPYGWMEFDPTPVQQQPPDTGLARFWAGFMDAVDLWWWERVVNYNTSRQYNLVANVYSVSGAVLNSIENSTAYVYEKSREGAAWIVSPKALAAIAGRWYWGTFFLILIVLLITPLRKYLRNRMRPVLYRNKPKIYADSFYTEALEMLSKYGMVRAPAQTPMEFALGLSKHPAGTPLIALTRLYNRIRFGPPNTSPNDTVAEDLLQSLRSALSG